MKYFDTRTLETLSESDIEERYEEYAYWLSLDGECTAVCFEQWLNTALEKGDYEEIVE